MNSLTRLLAILVIAPMAAGCFTVGQVAVPPTAPEREGLEVRGVVVREAGGTERLIEFVEVHEAEWTPTSLSIVADVEENGQTQTITRLFPISTLSGVLVRQLDAGKTSAIIGGVIVGTAAFIAGAVSGGTTTTPSD